MKLRLPAVTLLLLNAAAAETEAHKNGVSDIDMRVVVRLGNAVVH